jgi:hypothetical protein
MRRIARMAGLTGLALVGLAACGKSGSSAGSSAPPSQAPQSQAPQSQAPAASSAPAALSSMPHRKDGLWEQRMTAGEGGPVVVTRICTDSALEDKLGVAGARVDRSKCSSYSVTQQLNGDYAFSSVCDLGPTGGVATSNGVMHRDGDSGYHMDLDTKTTGASIAQLNVERKMSMDGKWLGPCAPGQKPGDMMVNGMKINPMGGAGGAPAGE